MLPRASLLALLASTNLAVSQTLPTCANLCFSSLISSGAAGSCSSTDLACLCKNKTWLNASICCLHENCSDADRETADEYSRSACLAVGASIPTGLTGCATSTGGIAQSTASGSSNSDSDNDSSTSDNNSSGSSGSSGGSHITVPKKKKKTNGTALGAGLGVGIPALASAAGALLLWWRKKKKGTNVPPPQEMPVQQVYSPPQDPAYQGQSPVTYPYQNNGYSPLAPPPQQVPPPQQMQQMPVMYEKDGAVMTGTSPANPAELGGEYRQQNELAGSTPQPVHELPPNYPQNGHQGQHV